MALIAVVVERFHKGDILFFSYVLVVGLFAVLAACHIRGNRRSLRLAFFAALAVAPVYPLLLDRAPSFIMVYLLAVFVAFVFVEIVQHKSGKERLRVLEYSREIGEADDSQDACRRAANFIIESLGYQVASVLLYEKEQDALVLKAVSGADTSITEVPRGKGVTWRAFLYESQQMVPDITVEPDYVPGVPGIRSEMVTPVMWKEQIFGVLNVESGVRDVFSASDAKMMELLSGILGQAIHRLNTESALREEYATQRKQAGAHRVIFEMFHEMARYDSIEHLTRCVVDGMTERLGYPKMFIYLRNDQESNFRLAAAHGRKISRNLMSMVFEKGTGIVGRVMQTGEPYMTNDALSDPWFVDDDDEETLVRIADRRLYAKKRSR